MPTGSEYLSSGSWFKMVAPRLVTSPEHECQAKQEDTRHQVNGHDTCSTEGRGKIPAADEGPRKTKEQGREQPQPERVATLGILKARGHTKHQQCGATDEGDVLCQSHLRIVRLNSCVLSRGRL